MQKLVKKNKSEAEYEQLILKYIKRQGALQLSQNFDVEVHDDNSINIEFDFIRRTGA